MLNIFNKVIEYSFYILLFLVPLVFAGDTSELFEFNKMWLTFGITIIIAAAWGSKMILEKKIRIQKTPLDIPILLFLLSQIISTIFSLDSHVSLWGYYSRFNGGLLSIATYIFLYYALVTNFTKDKLKWLIMAALLGGAAVTLWGLPSHFGYDPTCLIFRGKLDVNCWTAAFQPKVRIFSTLGQPNWLAAYLSILLPVSIALGLGLLKPQEENSARDQNSKIKNQNYNSKFKIFGFETQPFSLVFALLSALFFLAIVFTGSRSGFAGLGVGLLLFLALIKDKRKLIAYVFLPLLILCLIFGTPFDSQIQQVTQKFFHTKQTVSQTKAENPTGGTALELGGTESGTIRLIVWRGAIDAWLHNPIFGTGVETFAFAYYKYRPAAHNLTSEWDYLYNKAHNEYLNYLTTTGVFGLGSYLLMIGAFLFVSIKKLKTQNSKLKTTVQNAKVDKEKFLALSSNFELCALSFALISSYVSILVSNFLGFSVVIINIFFFLIPAFVFILEDLLDSKNSFEIKVKQSNNESVDIWQIASIFVLLLVTCYLLLTLLRFYQADKYYALGQNLDQAGDYQNAFIPLSDAWTLRPSEPTFQDELSYNTAALSLLFKQTAKETKDASDAAKIASYSSKLTKEALTLSNNVVSKYPNNIVFWKTRIRMFYLLSQLEPSYLNLALDSAKHAQTLAPTDAKVSYSLGILYGQTGDDKTAIQTLKQTIKLKPDYKEAYYALGLFYRDLATDKNNRVINSQMEQNAVDTMHYILGHFATDDAQTLSTLKSWGVE